MAHALSVESVDPRWFPDLAAALREAGLPADDLDQPGRIFFAFTDETGQRFGYIGAELMGQVALLRSLVVLPPFRRRGYAHRLMNWLLAWLDRAEAHDIYLLTATVAPLMETFGFHVIDRAEAPEAIRHTHEFAALDSRAAILMRRPPPA